MERIVFMLIALLMLTQCSQDQVDGEDESLMQVTDADARPYNYYKENPVKKGKAGVGYTLSPTFAYLSSKDLSLRRSGRASVCDHGCADIFFCNHECRRGICRNDIHCFVVQSTCASWGHSNYFLSSSSGRSGRHASSCSYDHGDGNSSSEKRKEWDPDELERAKESIRKR